MNSYDLEYLKKKGFFETERCMEDDLESGEEIEYIFDPEHKFAYFEDFDRDRISNIVKSLKRKRTFDYYWFWEEGRVCCFRTHGEHKKFIYNLKYKRKSEWRKGKKKKLTNFSSQNPDVLFEVKEVIDRFYRRLWSLRVALADSIKNDVGESEKIMCAQRIIDRLIFVYFLTEKGIIRVLDKRKNPVLVSTKKLFTHLLEKSTCFYDTLNRIFFDFLNNKKKEDMPVKEAEKLSLRIPYLNGGLFREKSLPTPEGEIEESGLTIESFDWEELVDELNRYNWIIEEFRGEEKGIDEMEDVKSKIKGNLTPEILGHIYEKFVIEISELDEIDIEKLKESHKKKLKKGRKKVGGYYTPEDVTRYISQNTLWPFLSERLGIEEEFNSFEEFFETQKDNKKLLKEANNILKNVKVLDPAVGSGHFLLTVAEIIQDWRRKCGEDISEHDLRMEIVTKNLYGVDIMGGAVEICKLRLWLWIIAGSKSAERIEPLPNIEFNYRQGNSLVGFIETPWEDTESVGNYILRTKEEKQRRLKEERRKQAAFEQGESISEVMKKRKELIDKYKTSSKSPEEIKKKIEEKSKPLKKKLDEKFAKRVQDFTNLEKRDVESLNLFHWGFEFYNVLNSEASDESGFDIVIGNPPYGNILDNKEKAFISKFSTSSLNDISVNFIEREIKLLSKKGKFGNIATVRCLYDSRFRPFHKLLEKHFEKIKIASFERRPSQVFRDAQVQVGVIVGSKKPSNDLNGTIKTSKFIRFSDEERKEKLKLEDISYCDIDDLILRERIGGSEYKGYEILPKIGNEKSKSILRKLKIASEEQIINDSVQKNGNYTIYRQRGGGYRPIAMLEKMYDSTGLVPINFEQELNRDLSFLIVNSQLFYLYWMVYSNARNLDTGLIKRFPLPFQEKMNKKKRSIKDLKEKTWNEMNKYFDDGRNYIYMSKMRSTIKEINSLLADFFGLSDGELKFVETYDSEYIWTKS